MGYSPIRYGRRVVRAARGLRFAWGVTQACSRGSLDAATRRFDPAVPKTWEFSTFSQNGEDGVIDHLLSFVKAPNFHFLEIGASFGLENNSAFLAFVKNYEGVMVEGDASVAAKAKANVERQAPGVHFMSAFVKPETAGDVLAACRHSDPDFFSMDIDSSDLHVTRALLDAGLRPKVACVEYNSAFGPHRAVTVPADAPSHASGLYYGASVAAWRQLLEERGMRFVTVERRGVNAFFIDPAAVETSALRSVQSLGFAENVAQLQRHPTGWESQFALVSALPLMNVQGDEVSPAS